MRKSEVVLSFALIISISASLWLWSELRAERARNAGLIARPRPVLPIAVHQSPERAPAAEPTAAIAAVNVSTAAAAGPGKVIGAQEDSVAYQRRMMRDPKYREIWRAQRRLNFAPRRENAIRLLGITPAQADAIIELGLDRELALYDVMTPPDPKPADYRQQQQALYEASRRAEQEKLRELLGEEKRAQWQTYMESRDSRMQVDQFRTQLLGADTLRDDQVEPLIMALHVERAQMEQALDEYRNTLTWGDNNSDSWQKLGEKQTELMEATHARMHSSAGSILSRTQLEKLDALLRRDLDRHVTEQRMRRLQSNIGATASSTAAD